MLRFTIRDVLWLTVVVGMGVGWVADRGSVMSRGQDKFDTLWRHARNLESEVARLSLKLHGEKELADEN